MEKPSVRDWPEQATIDLERFFALSIDMLCIAGFDGYFKRVNDAWERTLGWTAEEMTAHPWVSFVHPDDVQSTIDEAAKQTEAGLEAISFENRYRAKDGSYHWLQWYSRPSAEHEEMHAIARDVTNEKIAELALKDLNRGLERQVEERTRAAEARALRAEKAERALRDTEAQARAILNSTVSSMITIDEDGTIESVNPATERVFGYAATEMIGSNISMLMPSPDREKHDSYLENYRRTGERKIIGIGREVVGRRSDGRTFPAELAVTEVLLGDRRIFSGIVRDIGERRRAELALQATSDDLRRTNTELEALVHSVSHDLQEPLRTLDAFSKFLVKEYDEKLDDDGKDYLRRLSAASSRMKVLIDAVLVISRIGRTQEGPQQLVVPLIIEELVRGARSLIEERNATVEIVGVLPRVFAGPRTTEKVFGDLIVNAIKFNRGAAPRVEIGAFTNDAGEAVFFVRDNGIGIHAEFHDRVFGIFQRLNHREEFEGTGAGLAVVKRAVESLGGRIWLESNPYAGVTFYFTLPIMSATRATD